MIKKLYFEDNNSINGVKLFNLDQDTFVSTLSKSMGSFSLNTNNDKLFSGSLNCYDLPAIKLARICINQSISVKTSPQSNAWKFDIPIKGELVYHNMPDSFIANKSGFKIQLGESLDFKISNNQRQVELLCPIFEPGILSDYVTKLTNGQYRIDNLKLTQKLPLDTPEGQSFLRTLHFLYKELEQENPGLQSPLILAQFQDATISMLLYAIYPQIFSPTHSSDQTCIPKYVKLAQDYIHANLKAPISVADIASAVNVSYSSLFKGFKKYLHITPMRYLKARRLECAYKSLLESNPTYTNVSEIALEWGFSNLGNFSLDYRQVFGQSPSKTLRSEKMFHQK